MGVHSFWDIVEPTARPVRLESLEDKKMAIDASIWIYQFLKAMRDPEGNAIKNSHVTGFFRRICKLLYFGIKPVFVFDGGVPVLKRKTIKARNEARQGKRESAARTARKLLALQLHGQSEKSPKKPLTGTPPAKIFSPQDDWDLPNLEGFYYDKNDQRINAQYDEEKRRKILENATVDEILDDIDIDSINPTSKEFEELPNTIQYQILANLRLKSRLRMGYSKEQLEKVFTNSIDFSKFQIDMVRRRNFYTQKLIGVTGIHDGGASKLENEEVRNRIAGQKDREYKITKTENGWTLGMGDFDGSEKSKAIVLDKETVKREFSGDDADDEEFEWEDVNLESSNPKKDNFDYSLKAGRLPQFEETVGNSGSMSFLDTRPAEESPVKKVQKRGVTQTVEIDEEPSDLEDTVKSDDDIMDFAERECDADDEMKPKTAIIEGTSDTIQRTAVDLDRGDNSEDEYLDHMKELELMKESVLAKAKGSGPSARDHNAINLTTNLTATSQGTLPQTAGEQDLNLLMGKLTDSSQSFLFNSKADKLVQSAPKQMEIPEMPDWFQTQPQFISGTEGQSSFVVDKQPKEIEGAGPGYTLVDGYLNTESFLEERNKEPATDEVEIIEPAKRAKKASDDTENTTMQYHDHSTNASSVTKPVSALPNYEFSEEEEENLINDMRNEVKDFEQFKTNELLMKSSEDVVSTAFVEDDLFDQQVKDKRDADEVTPQMVEDIQELLSRFGIPFIVSPMEAEAQCAELLGLNLVDGIITDDSDVFLFGGTKVYKNLFQDRKYVEYYDYETIVRSLGIDRAQMIELALLLGSDYTPGIKSMGPVSSVEILAEFGDLSEFKRWYEEGQLNIEAQSKDNKFRRDLRKRLVKNDVLLDPDFPSGTVIDAYLHPEVDHDKTSFRWSPPDLDMLRTFLHRRLGWPDEKSDEVLVPLIRDINRRSSKGRQTTLNEFFPREYIEENRKRASSGKRIFTATEKLKKRRLR
ncbi:ssDNA endodeoxyribonuclease RAD2 KNAG_0K00370 [Huiozyma naganishii CBS 8797]|uniref:DNA repair protein RAD2 n=1 Tax=Huiozyma naganishii (strain ATCC MYA-139 / BCRC 22969 / CBS 8797 / KCTC 17520 / NBRC 10181 / NCYC 3082 / Yp74L-3) TaxID=1071383 RepID=J7RBX4_HUIN7|nr:hypothetical protein KNAG_0K00370 [Kazachstania naganishii CBS 8797]CCK72405.1 hypothetical protein KNAG_0K00370 [Kazachstania naganishii CBS 8797]